MFIKIDKSSVIWTTFLNDTTLIINTDAIERINRSIKKEGEEEVLEDGVIKKLPYYAYNIELEFKNDEKVHKISYGSKDAMLDAWYKLLDVLGIVEV